ncbi:unnamed protein product [Echinostoma caproni]|uniref:NTF2 domain-containing protein n=1 Tax=Echinostoma caproni TaxID=27848 RepID=A0A183B5Y1_9TREM|nr:unnamed protein product [Echinostoma caproni]
MVAGDNNSAMPGGFIVSRMDPSEVLNLAGEFVVQYYTVMRKCPSGLHRFYKDDSAMIRENATVFGQKMIHEKIMSMNIGNSRVGILRLDALRANGNSVLIQVSGEVSFGGSEFRRFMQSFVLCEQAPYDFYVLNDIFRYQDHVYGDVKAENVPTEVETETPHRDEVETRDEEPPREPAPSPQSPAVQQAVTQAPSSVEPTQPAPQQPRSWAQMVSKQPSHPVVNMQSKPMRASMPAPAVQGFDDSNKGVRPSAATAGTSLNQR